MFFTGLISFAKIQMETKIKTITNSLFASCHGDISHFNLLWEKKTEKCLYQHRHILKKTTVTTKNDSNTQQITKT